MASGGGVCGWRIGADEIRQICKRDDLYKENSAKPAQAFIPRARRTIDKRYGFGDGDGEVRCCVVRRSLPYTFRSIMEEIGFRFQWEKSPEAMGRVQFVGIANHFLSAILNQMRIVK